MAPETSLPGRRGGAGASIRQKFFGSFVEDGTRLAYCVVVMGGVEGSAFAKLSRREGVPLGHGSGVAVQHSRRRGVADAAMGAQG